MAARPTGPCQKARHRMLGRAFLSPASLAASGRAEARRGQSMAVVIRLTWHGITPAQYEQARERVGWERDVPPGGVCHVAWFTPEGLNIVNVWENAEEFRHFAEERLMPVGKGELGAPASPRSAFTRARPYSSPRTHRSRCPPRNRPVGARI